MGYRLFLRSIYLTFAVGALSGCGQDGLRISKIKADASFESEKLNRVSAQVFERNDRVDMEIESELESENPELHEELKNAVKNGDTETDEHEPSEEVDPQQRMQTIKKILKRLVQIGQMASKVGKILKTQSEKFYEKKATNNPTSTAPSTPRYSCDYERSPRGGAYPIATTCRWSPLVLEFGAQILLSSQEDGVEFDIRGVGEKDLISWPIDPARSPLLVFDKNANRNIESVHELFGDQTIGPDGEKAQNGFMALRKYDFNRDNRITPRDKIYSKLELWFDINRNGESEASELKTLREAGVTLIDLNYANMLEVDSYGNMTLQRSVFLLNGEMKRIFDVWFNVVE